MSCKCDPSWGNGGECCCKNSPPLPAGSPRRALNPSICPRDTQCGSGFPSFSANKSDDDEDSRPTSRKIFTTREDKKFSRPKIIIPMKCGEERNTDVMRDMDTDCVSLRYQRRAPCAKPLSPKSRKPRCPARGPEPVREPPPCRHGRGRRCSSEKKRNLLKAKLRELLSGIEPIPESCLLESAEFKPEPEVLAEVLFMSEAEGIDLAEVKPGSVFDNLFADVSFEQPIAIANATPGSPISDVVVPVHVSGQESAAFEMVNIETVMENTRNAVPPKPNAFQQSTAYESFSSHMNELLDRSPTSENISEFLGASVIEDEADGTQRTQDGILDYIIKPGQTTSGHSNRVRLNGSTKPIWFPGYILVSPNIPGCIRMTEDPGEALKEAWRLCRPRNFKEDSRYLVDVA